MRLFGLSGHYTDVGKELEAKLVEQFKEIAVQLDVPRELHGFVSNCVGIAVFYAANKHARDASKAKDEVKTASQ